MLQTYLLTAKEQWELGRKREQQKRNQQDDKCIHFRILRDKGILTGLQTAQVQAHVDPERVPLMSDENWINWNIARQLKRESKYTDLGDQKLLIVQD